jgi:hypothetical protein
MPAAMAAADTLAGLARFTRRGAGTDAERRAAAWLARELITAKLQTRVEPFWCRPNWALAHAWHVALALAGSLMSVHSARVGGAMILVALLSLLADAILGSSPGRRLTPERASQNVIAATGRPAELRLIITANYDAGRTGLVYRAPLRAAAARVRTRLGPLTPGWLGWLALMMVWLEGTAVARLEGSHGTAVGIAQLVPTVVLVLAFALLLDQGTAEFGPAAGDNGSGVAAAVALARVLSVAPPANAGVELVLQGASDASGIGLRTHLRRNRAGLRPTNAVVIGVAPCGSGTPRWWISDGQLIPLGYLPQLRRLAEQVARQRPALGAAPHRARGWTPALPARSRALPSLSIGALDQRGLAPRSHEHGDTLDAVDPAAIERVVEFGLLLVDAIDDFLARRSETPDPAAPPAPPAPPGPPAAARPA